ncbi:MAG TPA: hypothetical protein VK154_13100 [Chitinophagales bacterium]|nr:hypothetical protein [Chitinophagales bacterium]
MKTLLVFFIGCLLVSPWVGATTHVIYFAYPSYSPSGLSVYVGDTIVWEGDFAKFPISATSLPAGASSFAKQDGDSFTYVVQFAGSYKYQCDTYKQDKMIGYFVATVEDKTQKRDENSMVYINYFSHAFHLVTPDVIPHNAYTVTIAKVNGDVVYKGELKPADKDMWIATEHFTPGTYLLTATDGTHSFGRKFTK